MRIVPVPPALEPVGLVPRQESLPFNQPRFFIGSPRGWADGTAPSRSRPQRRSYPRRRHRFPVRRRQRLSPPVRCPATTRRRRSRPSAGRPRRPPCSPSASKSSPGPPTIRSGPRLPSMSSSPSPPNMRSALGGASRAGGVVGVAGGPPSMKSSPPTPDTRSLPPPPASASSPSVPTMASPPGPPTSLTAAHATPLVISSVVASTISSKTVRPIRRLPSRNRLLGARLSPWIGKHTRKHPPPCNPCSKPGVTPLTVLLTRLRGRGVLGTSPVKKGES